MHFLNSRIVIGILKDCQDRFRHKLILIKIIFYAPRRCIWSKIQRKITKNGLYNERVDIPWEFCYQLNIQ